MIEYAEATTIEPVFAFSEEPDRYLLKGLVAGAIPGDLEVTVDKGALVVRGTAAVSWSDGESLDYRRERQIDVRFALPDDADAERLATRFGAGVLAVCVPKREKVCGALPPEQRSLSEHAALPL
jgi:HSP20 family molecular chaperone IbpA